MLLCPPYSKGKLPTPSPLPDERDRFLEGPRTLLSVFDPSTNVSSFRAGLTCLRNRDGSERLLSAFRMKMLLDPNVADSASCTSVIIKGAAYVGEGVWHMIPNAKMGPEKAETRLIVQRW